MPDAKKTINTLLSVLLFAAVAAVIIVYLTGGYKFDAGIFRISMTSMSGAVRFFFIILILKTAFLKKPLSFEEFLSKTLCFFGKSDGSPARFVSPVTYIFIAGSIVMGISDIFVSSPEKKRVLELNPLPLTYMERFSNTGILILFYGAVFFIAGVVFSKLIYSLKGKQKFLQMNNPVLFSVSVLVVAVNLLLSDSSYTAGFLKNYKYTVNAVTDSVLFIILCFLLFYCLPLFIKIKDSKKISLAIAAFLLFFFSHPAIFYFNQIMAHNETGKKHRRVILITIDTTRADHFSSYGYPENTTPALDKLAEEGILFKNVYSQIPTTDPSHASILTGAYPRTHGLLSNGGRITKKGINSLQLWFKDHGYATAAITSRPHLNPESMELPGFDYINVPSDKPELVNKNKKDARNTQARTASNTYRRTIKWLDNNYYKDFFLWIHFWDPHDEYKPPAPFNSKFNGGFKSHYRMRSEHNGFFVSDDDRYSEGEIDYMVSLYDGEIAFVDHHIDKLIKYFKNKLPADVEKPLFIITADHGESLGELQDSHNYAFKHAKLVRYGSVHIPLIINWEGMLPTGKIMDEVIESIDIAPTIVNLVSDNKEEYKCDGTSFKSFINNGSKWEKDTAFAQRRIYLDKMEDTEFLNAREYGVMTDEWFLAANELKGNELYNIKSDPLEQNNLAEKEQDVVRELLARLDSWKDKIPETKPYTERLSEDKAKTLKSLGYL